VSSKSFPVETLVVYATSGSGPQLTLWHVFISVNSPDVWHIIEKLYVFFSQQEPSREYPELQEASIVLPYVVAPDVVPYSSVGFIPQSIGTHAASSILI
jgi:hypothetical protein